MKITEPLDRCGKWLRDIVLVREKPGMQVKLPIRLKLKYNRMGFTEAEYVLYDLAHNDPGDYISMQERWRLEPLNGKYARMLGRKLQFERSFAPYVHVPHVYCWIRDGRLINMDDPASDFDVCGVLREQGALIAKPTQSKGGGTGVFAVCASDRGFVLDQDVYPEEHFLKRLLALEDYMLVEQIRQHPYAENVYPFSGNTIRIVTGMRRDRRAVDLLFAFHRFGSRRSEPTDSASRGGFFAQIDEASGICGKASSILSPDAEFSKHPETGAAIEGLQVPGWETLVRELKAVHLHMPYYELLAWDVMLDKNEMPWVIEINRGTDLIFQVNHPMRKEKMGRFMDGRGLLDRRR